MSDPISFGLGLAVGATSVWAYHMFFRYASRRRDDKLDHERRLLVALLIAALNACEKHDVPQQSVVELMDEQLAEKFGEGVSVEAGEDVYDAEATDAWGEAGNP